MKLFYKILFLFLIFSCNKESGIVGIGQRFVADTTIPCDSCTIITSNEDKPHYVMLCQKGNFKLFTFFYSAYLDNAYCITDTCNYPFETSKAKIVLYNGEKRYIADLNYFKEPLLVTKNKAKRDDSNIYDIQSGFIRLINESENDTLTASINIKNKIRDSYFRIDN